MRGVVSSSPFVSCGTFTIHPMFTYAFEPPQSSRGELWGGSPSESKPNIYLGQTFATQTTDVKSDLEDRELRVELIL